MRVWAVVAARCCYRRSRFRLPVPLGPWGGADLERRARRYATEAAALDHTHVQEGIARPIGKLYEAESFVRVVPFDYGLDRGTGRRFKPLGARSRCRPETALGRFEVVVVEGTATGRAKISVSAAHVIPWERMEFPQSEMRKWWSSTNSA